MADGDLEKQRGEALLLAESQSQRRPTGEGRLGRGE